jgi:hypothetical protein
VQLDSEQCVVTHVWMSGQCRHVSHHKYTPTGTPRRLSRTISTATLSPSRRLSLGPKQLTVSGALAKDKAQLVSAGWKPLLRALESHAAALEEAQWLTEGRPAPSQAPNEATASATESGPQLMRR